MTKTAKLQIMINLYYMLECFTKKPIVLFAFKPNLVLISGTLVAGLFVYKNSSSIVTAGIQ